MQEKGLGTPATRAAIIEGLINEKYMLREGRELIPTAKAFQLMTLLRGLGVEELSQARADRRVGIQARADGARQARARRVHARDRRDDASTSSRRRRSTTATRCRATTPRSTTPCPNCGGVVKENYRRYTCTGKPARHGRLRLLVRQDARRAARSSCAEVEQFLRDKRIGPLEGFRSKAGWPFTAEIVLKYNEEEKNWKLEFDFGDDGHRRRPASWSTSPARSRSAPARSAAAASSSSGSNYVCEHAVPTDAQPEPTCDFKSRQDHPAAAGRRASRWPSCSTTGKTDLLDKFVSMRTRRAVQGVPGVGRGGRQGQLRVRRRRSSRRARTAAVRAARRRRRGGSRRRRRLPRRAGARRRRPRAQRAAKKPPRRRRRARPGRA